MTKKELGFTPEQLEHIRYEIDKLKAKYVAIAQEKEAARLRAGTVTPEDLEFGKRLQSEMYKQSQNLRREIDQRMVTAATLPTVQKIGETTQKQRSPRPTGVVKKPSILKRIATFLHNRKKIDDPQAQL